MKKELVDNYFDSLDGETRTEILRRSSPVSEYLYGLIAKNKFKNILEIGTFKGNNTMYMAAAAESYGGKVTTVNISHDEMNSAKELLHGINLENVDYVVGDSIEMLKTRLKDEVFDFVFIDGNHSYTYSYNEYKLVSENMVNGLIIFDDAVGVHSDSKGDGGVPRTITESGATLVKLPKTTIGYKVIGTNVDV